MVESISCRQLYLRSYTFTRKESVNEKTKKCIGRVKERVVNGGKKRRQEGDLKRERSVRNVKEVSCAALKAIFRKLLFCSASVDVVDGNDLLVR